VKISQAEEFILADEKRFLRDVTTGGTNLSGGQKQRTLISRAVLGNPEIIILDDSSSALDYKTDLKLRRAIKENLNTTTVIVSQRIASVMSADKIIVIDEGRIVGIGKHNQLLSDCEIYKQIAEVQLK
jgi:ATP-binding cassette subfamily B protein